MEVSRTINPDTGEVTVRVTIGTTTTTRVVDIYDDIEDTVKEMAEWITQHLMQ